MITKTTWIIIITVALWIGWDVWLFVTGKPTISDEIFGITRHAKSIVFAAGFVCGHWFWPYHVNQKGEEV